MPREQLRRIASLHRIICICILVYFAIIAVAAATRGDRQAEAETSPYMMLVGLAYIAAGITAAVCAFLLAIQLHGTVVGVLLGVLTLVPCLGILILLSLSIRATASSNATVSAWDCWAPIQTTFDAADERMCTVRFFA